MNLREIAKLAGVSIATVSRTTNRGTVREDLSVIGFDDISLAQFMIPHLTTVQMSQIKIAETTFKALIEKARPTGYASSREVYPIKTRLVLRHSTTLAPDRVRDRCSVNPVKPAAKKKNK
jgi:DNA-binding LacI/PurR family transcriptional regulator